MACYTSVEVLIDDNALNRKARSHLGLSETGYLPQEDARRVKVEAGVLKSIQQIKKLSPSAIIVRKGNELSVSIQQ